MSKIEMKKTTWTVSPTTKKVITFILYANTGLDLQSIEEGNKERQISICGTKVIKFVAETTKQL